MGGSNEGGDWKAKRISNPEYKGVWFAKKIDNPEYVDDDVREKWRVDKHEESIMREIHGHIHDEWCIHPPFFAEIDDWLSHS